MTDSPAVFRQKTAAMFAQARGDLQETAREFVRLCAVDIVKNTPGFGNQAPETTQYVPTGRLRGGWNWSPTRLPVVARFDGGPYSDYGDETIARITEQLQGQHMGGTSFLENDVAYGSLIVRGEGRHTAVGPRNWPYDTSLRASSFAQQAQHNGRAI